MRLGIVADTHDRIGTVERAVAAFRTHDVSAVIHCGDITTPKTATHFRDFEFHAVMGNNDEPHAEALESTIAGFGNGSRFHGLFADLEFDGHRFGVLHGVVERTVYEHAESGEFEYVLHGHFHEREATTIDGTTVINPGAHRSVVVIETQTDDTMFVSLQ